MLAVQDKDTVSPLLYDNYSKTHYFTTKNGKANLGELGGIITGQCDCVGTLQEFLKRVKQSSGPSIVLIYTLL